MKKMKEIDLMFFKKFKNLILNDEKTEKNE